MVEVLELLEALSPLPPSPEDRGSAESISSSSLIIFSVLSFMAIKMNEIERKRSW